MSIPPLGPSQSDGPRPETAFLGVLAGVARIVTSRANTPVPQPVTPQPTLQPSGSPAYVIVDTVPALPMRTFAAPPPPTAEQRQLTDILQSQTSFWRAAEGMQLTPTVVRDLVALQNGTWMSPELTAQKLRAYASGTPIEELIGDRFSFEARTPASYLAEARDFGPLEAAINRMLLDPAITRILVTIGERDVCALDASRYTAPTGIPPLLNVFEIRQEGDSFVIDAQRSPRGTPSTRQSCDLPIGVRFCLARLGSAWRDEIAGTPITLPPGTAILFPTGRVNKPHRSTHIPLQHLSFTLPKLTPAGAKIGAVPPGAAERPDPRLATFTMGVQALQDPIHRAAIEEALASGQSWTLFKPGKPGIRATLSVTESGEAVLLCRGRGLPDATVHIPRPSPT